MPSATRYPLVARLVALILGPASWHWAPQHVPRRAAGRRGPGAAPCCSAAGGCANCHTDAKAKWPLLGGGAAIKTPFGTFYPPNISSDPQYGIGKWSDSDFIRALRDGISPEGDRYYPAFPFTSFTNLTDADMLAIKRYIMSLPPAKVKSRPHDLHFPFNIRLGMIAWDWLYLRKGPLAPDPKQSAEWNRGRYLAVGLVHCAECHTPRTMLGGLDRSRWMAGNAKGEGPDGLAIPNITPDPKDGIGKWSVDDIAESLGSGMTPDGDSFGSLMADVVENGTAKLSDATAARSRSISSRSSRCLVPAKGRNSAPRPSIAPNPGPSPPPSRRADVALRRATDYPSASPGRPGESAVKGEARVNRALVIAILGAVVLAAALLLNFYLGRETETETAGPAKPSPTVTVPPGGGPSLTAPEITARGNQPSFDIVRVNPEGNAVIAGRAAPGAEVTVLDGDRVVGKVTADARGEWVLVPDKPLAPGSRRLGLSARLKDGTTVNSGAEVVLVVPERGKNVAGGPGGGGVGRARSQGAVAGRQERQARAERGAAVPGRCQERFDALAIEVIDYDGEGHVRLSGNAHPGAHLRIYVDNRPVGETTADSHGRWSFQPKETLAPGDYSLRVDQLTSGGRVARRIEVPFNRAPAVGDLGERQIVVVQPGSSLWRIARRTYGTGAPVHPDLRGQQGPDPRSQSDLSGAGVHRAASAEGELTIAGVRRRSLGDGQGAAQFRQIVAQRLEYRTNLDHQGDQAGEHGYRGQRHRHIARGADHDGLVRVDGDTIVE